MDWVSFFSGLILGVIAAAVIAKWRRHDADEPQSPPPAGATDSASGLQAAMAELAVTLEPQLDQLAQPLDALNLADFQRGVALLRNKQVTVAIASGYLTGNNVVGCCLAAEALTQRDDGREAVGPALDHITHAYPWPLAFVLRFLDAHYDGPLLGEALARAPDWWLDNPFALSALNGLARARLGRGLPATFGDVLARTDPPAHVRALLGRLDAQLFSAMRTELDAWNRERPDMNFLRSVGNFVDVPGANEWAPRSARLDAYLARMIEAQSLSDRPRSLLLVAEPGVGADAVVKAFSAHLAAREWRVFETSASNLIAGRKYLGEIEQQIEKLCTNASAGKRIALRVKRLHELLAAGRAEARETGLFDLLLPPLERSEIVVVGQTTAEGLQRLLRHAPRLPTIMDIIRLQPADDAETLALVRDYLSHAGLADDEQTSALANETLKLARQYLSVPKTPGSALRLLELVVSRARNDGGDKPLQIGRDDVLLQLSRLTGLPLEVLDENQALDTTALTAAFERRVIGQPEAVRCLVERIAMVKAGLTDASRPIGVYLFAGPTGTGKTEIAKTLAELLFGDEERLVRLDMSEFQQHESLAKILGGGNGAAPDQSLIGRIRREPFSVILLDEFEKAHGRVWDLFLQVFDDGRLSDRAGNVANFRHTIIILTSNLGARIETQPGPGFVASTGFSASDVMQTITRSFRKEFVNRLDRVIVFNPLSRDVMRRILEKELRAALSRRGFRHREWAVEWEDTAVSFLLDAGFTVDMGARPLRRAIEQHFLAPLSIEIVENRFPEGDQFLFVRSDGESLQAIFVDPDAETEEPAPAATADRQAMSLESIVLGPTNSETERRYLADTAAAIAARLESAEWSAAKAALLAQINEPAFWRAPGRAETLDRFEFLDRLESAAAAIGRLAGRLERSGGSRQLNAQLAHKLFLVETALGDLDGGRPRDALLRVEAHASEDDSIAHQAYDSLKSMYVGWGRRRGMKTRVLDERDGAKPPSLTLGIAGFGAHTLLQPEHGLHVFEYPGSREGTTLKTTVRVDVAPQPPDVPAADLPAAAPRLFGAPDPNPVVVRRYRCLASPLVTDKVRGWRTGRLDLVLDGQFDLLA